MATYNVNTMQEFNNAIAGAGSGDIIEVNSDLDWNDVFDTQTTRVTLAGGDTINGLTINGNNHAIYNLTTGMVSGTDYGIFNFRDSTNIKIDSLSFLNCAFGSNNTQILYCYGSCTIKNAVIQGKFKGQMFRGSGLTIRDSMITVNYSTGTRVFSGLGGQNPKYRYCWIYLDNCIYEQASAGAYFSGLDGCYIEGKLGLMSAPDSPSVFAGVNNCCINCSVNPVNEPVLSDFITTTSGESGESATIINTDKIPALSELTSTTYVKLVTDEQMKDAEYLASIGFDIIP